MAAAQCRSSKCTAERKGFRRELDSWRHKLIHCVGFESILEGIYGPMLLRDLNIFDDCEPEEVDDWSGEPSCSHCSFCNLPLDKLCDQIPAAASPLSSPSDYSPCQATTLSESSQSAHRFLQAVFHKKDESLACDSNIPLVAQELMKKMIHQFAMEYASKSPLNTTTNGLTTGTSSPQSDMLDAPLDLTVSRSQEERELQPDGVLDLSKRTSACSASSSANNKASGFLLPTFTEELGDPGRWETQCGQNSALKAVLCSLCPAHRSLLYQILKVAHQERLLSLPHHRPVGQTDSQCCHRGVTSQDNITPRPFPFSECKARSSSPHYPITDCDHQGHSSTLYHPADSKSNCSVHHYPFSDCKSKAPQGSGCCCVQSCRVAAYPVFCLKSLHCISCQSLAVGHIDNVVCSFASSPSLSQSPSLCTSSSSLFPASSICCSHHNPHPCPCYSNHACLAQVRNTIEGGGGDSDPPCPVLKREQSPSPPPLSPIPSDINRKTEEKPPSLLCHRHDDRADLSLPLMVKGDLMDASQQEVGLDTATEEELECRTPRRNQAEQNPNRSLLQDVVDRFSEKLETIRPLEKDPPQTSSAIHTIEKEQPLSPSANQSLQFHDDAHLSEIITTVLHTGSDSDYNLSELFHRHDNNEAKSPNTRSRRRQEVLAAMAPITPADHASTRRHSLQIKRELAMFDTSYCRKKLSLSKRVRLKDSNNVTLPTSSSSDTTPVKEESERQMGIQEMKGLGPKQEMDKIRKEIWMESVMVGEGSITKDKEIESMTEQEEGKISDVSRMEKGVEDADIERVRERQGNTLTAEKERVEIKEEIHAVIVTEEIETIKVEEKERKIATEEKEQIAPDTQIPMTEQTKYYNLGLKGESLQSEIVAVTTASMTQCSRACEIDCEGSNFGNDPNQEEAPSSQSSDSDSTPDRGKPYHRPIRGRKMTSLTSLSSHSRDGRRSRRNIVPPQRFSSYVTEPRKMYFVACFSESIFNQRTPKDKGLKSSTLHGFSKIPDVKDNQLESRKDALLTSPEPTGELFFESSSKEQFGTYTEDQSQVFPLTVAGTEKSPTIHSSQNRTDVRDMPYRRLRSSPLQDIKTASRTPRNCSKLGVTSSDSSATCVQSPPNTQIQYISPIKLMYVSPVMDEEGVKYSLKSAASGSSGQAEEPFDPCEESSWAGTVEKKKSQGAVSVTSQMKSISSPLKSATSPAKSASTPPKSASSPPKSASSSPRVGARRSGEGTPPKRAVGTENHRSPGDLIPFHETTPPKRRPGRPKKLGPQLEKKVKRPIGRPRKQKALNPIMGVNAENVNTVLGSDIEENTNKNLKITVVYGRSRRNKRLVSEGFDQLQTELHDAWQAVGRNHDLSSLTQSSQTSSGSVTAASTDWSDELNLVRPVKDRESAPHSSSNIKCQKIEGAVPIRKPGRPAKVKISGISVTVTTVSPRQRKIQMNRDARQSPETLSHKKALLPVFKSAKEPWTINLQTSSDHSQTEGKIEAKDESRDRQTDRPLAVRHSVRVRKPSVYLLHSVATSTSRSYSHSTALLKRSKQLLLNKASNERKREEARGGGEISVEKRQLFGQERKRICQDLGQVAGVSVDSIFPPRETVRWWTASTEEKTLNQELARRIRLVSDTWVSDTVENQEETAFKPRLGIKGITSFTKKPRHSSVVRMLFDCPPNKPSSCSMQQLCSWFMQTTETQSLAIVKKASSRNPYELMHYPHSANKSVCPSPQAERLRKHIKKFAKTVPKSPCEHQQAQERLRNRSKASFSTDNIKRQLFTPRFAPGRLNQGAPWWRGRALGKYPTTLLRARARFLTQKERDKWPKRHRNNQKEFKWRLAASLNGDVVTALQPRHKPFSRSATRQLFDCLESSCTTSSADQTQESMDVPKEHRLSSKAWSPETLKECRVFLKKINSPDNESTAEEEWDSCTVTLDDGSPSAYCFAGRERELTGVVKAVKTERKRRKRAAASRELENLASKSSHKQDEMQLGRQKRKYKSPGVVSTEPPQPPPPAKMLRQSRVKGLTGPRWCDFVFEN